LLSWLAVALSAATVRIDPASAAGPVGGIFDLNVNVAEISDLYAYQFDLAFDAGTLSASTVTESPFLSGGGATVFVPGNIDNTAGTITFIVNSLLGPTPGVDGTGALAAIRFTGKAVGASPVTLSNVLLLDSTGADIAATIENGSVTVSGTVGPEPGSMVLLLGGAAAVFATRKRLR